MALSILEEGLPIIWRSGGTQQKERDRVRGIKGTAKTVVPLEAAQNSLCLRDWRENAAQKALGSHVLICFNLLHCLSFP